MKLLSSLFLLSICLCLTWTNLVAQDYKSEWQKIDSLTNLGLPESALKETEALFDKVKKDVNNKNQTALFIKTLIYINKYKSQMEEDALAAVIYRFQVEMEKANGVNKSVLQSMLAELYYQFLQNHLYKLQDRTAVVDYKPEDVNTWDIPMITNKIFELYSASIQGDAIKKVKLGDYKDLLTQPNFDVALQPTLYDMLMSRAISFFANDNSYITQPAYKFYIDDDASFADAKSFVNHKFTAKDSIANKFYAVLMYQDLLRFHLNDADPRALADADFRRLNWMLSQSIISNKDELYLKAMNNIAVKYASNPLAAEALYYVGLWHYNEGKKYQPSPDQTYRWELKTAKELFENCIRKYPNSFGAANANVLLHQIEAKSFHLTTEEVTVPNQAILCSFQYKNLSKAHFKIIKVTEAELKKMSPLHTSELVAYINSLEASSTWSENLPNEGDYQLHRTEFKAPGQGVGLYLVVASDKADFNYHENAFAYALVNVSNIAFFTRQNNGYQDYYVTDRKTGAPMQGVKGEFFINKYNSLLRRYEERKVGELLSDKNGYLNSKSIHREGHSIYVKFSKGNDALLGNSSFYNYKSRNNNYKTKTTHFFLDRAIYRPGQTVYFKGIVISNQNGEHSIIPNFSTEVTFYDANYQKVAAVSVTTNEYGSYQGSFTAPSSGLLGQMRIQDSHSSGQKYFRVEEYKRPKFEVKFDPMKESFKIEDIVKVKGQAKAYAGSVIDGAKVQYRVVREVQFPYWRYWYWGWNPYQRAAQEIAFGETTSNEKGEYTIEFQAIPDKSIPKEKKPQFSYKVYADVTDITGETHSTQTYVNVGYIALIADINMGDNIQREAASELDIVTNNLNGEFEAATGTLKIELLETPTVIYNNRKWAEPDYFVLEEAAFKKDFPNLAFKAEDKIHNWKVKQSVLNTSFDTKKSKKLALTDVKNWAQGAYKLTLTTKDKYGSPIELIKYFNLYSNSANEIPANNALFLANSTFSVEPGETVALDFGSFDKNAWILYEVEHEGKLVSSEWVQPQGRKRYELQVEEKHRGNFYFHTTMILNNAFYRNSGTINVPWTNKELTIEYSTFRDKLMPGQEEEWRIKISGPKKDKVAAELLAGMYDASLDAFAANNWYLNLNSYNSQNLALRAGHGFNAKGFSSIIAGNWNKEGPVGQTHSYTGLNWFGFSFYDYGYNYDYYLEDDVLMDVPSRNISTISKPKGRSIENTRTQSFKAEEKALDKSKDDSGEQTITMDPQGNDSGGNTDFGDVKVRTNLNETVFFFPNLETDADGNVIIKFTMNEALTRWKFMLLAHSKDLKIGTGTKEVVTQKDLMVMPNAPRFFRQNDEIYFTAKVSNMTEAVMKGEAILQLFDAISMKPIDADFGNAKATVAFTAEGGQSAPLVWKLKIPDTWSNAVTYRVIAKAGNFSDGEESSLPVLSNRMMVTETMPLPVRGGQTKVFDFKRMAEVSKSTTMRNHKYTLEFTPNPAWYAVQALPYIMEYPYECTEQIFSRFYANSIATTVANSHPKIKKVFDTWKEFQPDALKSNLSKNEELKYALLEETPWVLNAQSEEQQKRDLGVLFDMNRMSRELDKARNKMADRQLGNGGFAWFPGGRDSWYITQYIVAGMGHLNELNVKVIKSDNKVANMLTKAVAYTDDRLAEHYEELLKWAKRAPEGEVEYLKKDHLDGMAVHYLYARSFYPDQKVTNNTTLKAIEYYEDQAFKYWLSKSDYMQGMLALHLHRKGVDKETPQKIVASLKERALKNEEMGMYWKYPSGYFWYEMPIETHCLLIEVFDVVAQDAQAVDDLKTYLLKNKQTRHWKTTKATASACYVLLRTGDNWLMEDQEIKITLGNTLLDQSKIQKEAGTGYFKTSWAAQDIKADMAKITVENPNKVVAWGAVYWQYFEELDKITHFKETPLKLNKKLFKEVRTDRGPILQPITTSTKLEPGDRIKVRIELKVDRDMEYVHMKDMRASGFEPENVLSSYKYQGGLGYYESTRDASTNFFFDFLSKGTYVFEYPLRVNHKGDFSNGITTIQCMYAPEFTAHSEGVRVTVD